MSTHRPARPPRVAITLGAVLASGALVLGLTGCVPASDPVDFGGSSSPSADAATGAPTPTPTPTPTWAPGVVNTLPADPVFDYQLGGAYDPPPGVTVVTRDSSADPVEGVYSICYVNAFQSQPDGYWPESLKVHDSDGKTVNDPAWPDESILDISTPDNRQAIADRTAVTVAGCAGKGFQAVEFDNLDAYTRSEGGTTLYDTIAYARLIVEFAHSSGLAVAQKNTPELEARGKTDIGFDFAVAEECQRFGECGAYTEVYGAAVLDIEYAGALGAAWSDVCADPALPAGTVQRDRKLVPAGEPGHVYARC